MTLAEIIEDHFSEYDKIKPYIKELQTTPSGLEAFVTSGLFRLFAFGIPVGYFLFDDVPLILSSLVGGLLVLGILAVAKPSQDLLESNHKLVRELAQTLYISLHGNHPDQIQSNITDEEIIRYWLYQIWTTDEPKEKEEAANELVKFYNGEYIRPPLETTNNEVQEFIEKLERNPEYQNHTITEDMPLILRHIVEFERRSHQLSNRGTFAEYETTDDHLSNLVSELNRAYQYELDSTVIILSRKFTENLLQEFYRNNYPKDARHMDDNNKPKSLGGLQHQMQDDIDHFSQYTSLVDDEFITRINRIRENGNQHVHNADVIYRNETLDQMKDDIEYVINVITTLQERLK